MLSNGAILKLSHYLVAIAGVVCVLNVAPKTKDTKHKHIFSDIQEVYGDFQAKAKKSLWYLFVDKNAYDEPKDESKE